MEQLMHQSFVLYLYVDFHIRVQLFLRHNSKKKPTKCSLVAASQTKMAFQRK